jgi:hypothetical protein
MCIHHCNSITYSWQKLKVGETNVKNVLLASKILPNTTFTSIPLASRGLGLYKLNTSYMIFRSLTYSFSVSTSSVITFCLCSAFFFLNENIISWIFTNKWQSVELYSKSSLSNVWGAKDARENIQENKRHTLRYGKSFSGKLNYEHNSNYQQQHEYFLCFKYFR